MSSVIAGASPAPPAEVILRAIGQPFFVVAADDTIVEANDATEHFFRIGRAALKRRKLTDLVPFGSPLVALVAEARRRGTPVNEYAVDLKTPANTERQPVDLQVVPMHETGRGDAAESKAAAIHPPGNVLVLMLERAMANKIDRQLTHRSAAKSVTGLAAMLGHEIKNPLLGIRGAAQLLGHQASADDKALTQLICDETDRICRLIDRWEVFSETRPIDGKPVNMHAVLDRVERIATSGFAGNIRFESDYDPSLPAVLGDADQLIQAFLNLVKNAAEALASSPDGSGVIHLKSAFRQGMRFSVSGVSKKVNLPLEFIVADNGAGVTPEMMPHLFEPFISTKANGSGLGLPLVAKVIGDHGGVIEYLPTERGSAFRVLLPMHDTSLGSSAGPPQEKQ
ncbi:Nitrogen regulation protein NtrB [hydrothermal vent metagenome]|uniref:Nitrogen regulation protein NtrB n=1 Tax=hydrothermal vent metagenome TaxID=652676 RepID=A0A3B0TG17_9ZZZZ